MTSMLEIGIYRTIKEILESSQKSAYTAVNNIMVEAYWNIGKIIIEAQNRNEKSGYGESLIKNLSRELTKEFGRGYSVSNLSYMRQFYVEFSDFSLEINKLSWTHYRLLLKVKNKAARDFYFEESVRERWSTRQLERQINTFFFERLLSSKNKNLMLADVKAQETGKKFDDIIKDPYILEFLNLEDKNYVYEKDLENALLEHLQKFLLELGKGFSFVARQKRINFGGENFYIDLVFYNYLLKCFVIIDLKVEKLTHQDLGQMQMYVNYYTREMMNDGDNPPIGIVLCSEKSDSVVKYTLPENNTQIFASKYMLYLPTEDELKKELEKERMLIETEKKLEFNK